MSQSPLETSARLIKSGNRHFYPKIRLISFVCIMFGSELESNLQRVCDSLFFIVVIPATAVPYPFVNSALAPVPCRDSNESWNTQVMLWSLNHSKCMKARTQLECCVTLHAWRRTLPFPVGHKAQLELRSMYSLFHHCISHICK
jgi:hypothetical protein